MDIEYVGEWNLAGNLGNLFIALAFAAAILSFASYLIGSLGIGNEKWKKLGRYSFLIHTFSIFAIIAVLFILLFNHRYEFHYVWKHSNNIMPMRYILSCFWEGQEGGFLLWMFWHVVLALFIVKKAGWWEGPVMTIISFVQMFLSCMLLGVYFGDYQFGINPFMLLREMPENFNLPWTQTADYLLQFPQFKDGRGLNPLLQNYWMVIHPPTVFLGFAATLFSFSYAAAGLWKKRFTEWIKPALPWAFLGVMVLGIGILMGGAWAYEALSFGGFWAWDPVENSSLVPWITLVGGAHLMLVNKNKPNSLFTTFLLVMISFVLVVYSTFLTKSGILGDTSVHSFVDSGILPQLLVYLLSMFGMMSMLFLGTPRTRWTFGLFCFVLLVLGVVTDWSIVLTLIFLIVSLAVMWLGYKRYIPRPEREEALWSREFWMFVGSVILLCSAVQITYQTSIAVFNVFLEPFEGLFASIYESTSWEWANIAAQHSMAPGENLDERFHQFQIPLTFLILILVASVQFLKYKDSKIKDVLSRLKYPLLISLILTFVTAYFLNFNFSHEWTKIALLFSCIFAVAANCTYILKVLKGKLHVSGASIAHIGFALVILGAAISTGKKEIISENQMLDVSQLGEDFSNSEDIALLEGDTVAMGDYFVSYNGRRTEGINLMFGVDYFEQIPRSYKEGAIVSFQGQFLEAKNNHQASPNLVDDLDINWRVIPVTSISKNKKISKWTATVPGKEIFTLEPRIQLNERMGNSPEPDTKHYLGRDLYTYIRWASLSEPKSDEEGYLEARVNAIRVGDSLAVSDIIVKVESLTAVVDSEKVDYGLLSTDLGLKVNLAVDDGITRKNVSPLYIIRDSLIIPDMVSMGPENLKFQVQKFDPLTQEIFLTVWQHKNQRKDLIVMQAIVFPQINILWIGCILMGLGTYIALRQRKKLSKKPVKSGVS